MLGYDPSRPSSGLNSDSTMARHFQVLTTFSRYRVTAEVKHNSTNTIVCKAQGEWNGTLEFTYSSGETKVIDTDKLPITKKKLRPVERQGRTESRWTLGICRKVMERRMWRNDFNLFYFMRFQEAVGARHQISEGREHRRGHGAQTSPGGATAGGGEAESS